MPASSHSPVFLIGHPRSGTTLLQLLLLTHPAFSSGPETHFFTYVMEPWASELPLEWLGHRARGPEGDEPIETLFLRLAEKPRIELNVASRERIRAANGAPAILDRLMRELATAPARRWIEKTPRHAYFASTILELFAGAKLVHLVRDPRSVASSSRSFHKLEPGSTRWEKVVGQRAESWMRIQDAVASVADTHRMITVRYEDLATDATGHMHRIFEFLGEDPAEADLARFSDRYDEVALASEHDTKGLCRAGRILDRSSIWKERLTPREADLVTGQCSATMARHGYR